jgi:hypothetical protein
VRETNPDYPQLSNDIWAFSNLGGDAFFLIMHFFVDTGILILIEMGYFSWVTKKFQLQVPKVNTELQKDDDVLAEEERVR